MLFGCCGAVVVLYVCVGWVLRVFGFGLMCFWFFGKAVLFMFWNGCFVVYLIVLFSLSCFFVCCFILFMLVAVLVFGLVVVWLLCSLLWVLCLWCSWPCCGFPICMLCFVGQLVVCC